MQLFFPTFRSITIITFFFFHETFVILEFFFCLWQRDQGGLEEGEEEVNLLYGEPKGPRSFPPIISRSIIVIIRRVLWSLDKGCGRDWRACVRGLRL